LVRIVVPAVKPKIVKFSSLLTMSERRPKGRHEAVFLVYQLMAQRVIIAPLDLITVAVSFTGAIMGRRIVHMFFPLLS
jgi:hypothetical protein